ncbi:MAG: hypothetical protein IKT40_00410 [Bacilli bacterium]|nr:hypothetical protein [Bacilli bacterium]
MKLNTLYKRNVNGSINEWAVHYDDQGYWTEYGLVDGAITSSDKVLVEAKNIGKKNETTVEEQALKEATAIWKKKIKSENFVENIDDVDNIAFQPPMLAKEYDGEYTSDIKFCQPKLDGIRCNIFLENGEVKAISRKNNQFYTVDHIKESLKDVLLEYPTLHFDGELYNHIFHDNFNKVVSLVKKEKLNDEDLQEVVTYVRYNVYDLWDDNNPNMTFEERNELINNILQDVPFVDIVETVWVSNADEVEDCFNRFTSNGYEGAILRKNNPYEHKRSKNLLKYKKFNEEEFEILDICEGKIKGYAEFAWVKLPNDEACKATLSYTDEECESILNDKDNIIGKLGTVKFFGYTNDGKLRFPVLKAIRDYE